MSGPAGPARDPRREGAAVAGSKRTAERLVALLAAGVVALNFPLLSVFRGRGLVAGIPVLYVYLFLVWLLLAAGTALILRRRPTRPRGPADAAGPHEP
jgi:hypothetical protein